LPEEAANGILEKHSVVGEKYGCRFCIECKNFEVRTDIDGVYSLNESPIRINLMNRILFHIKVKLQLKLEVKLRY
jgi:hypothetical protein